MVSDSKLAELLDAPALQSLMDDFYDLVSIPMAIIDQEGRVLVGVGWQDVCTRFHRVHPQTCRACIESDTELTEGIEEGEFRLYKCKNHMWDVATPIVVNGRHVGNVFTGQFFFDDEPIDYDVFRHQANEYGFDEAQYLAALDRVPRLSRERVNRGLAFFVKLAHMVSRLAATNLSLRQAVDERNALIAARDEALRAESEHRERLRVTMESMGDGVIVTDDAGRVRFLNRVAERLTGWSREDARERPLADVFQIINEATREVVESPVVNVLRAGEVVGLANHTLLIARDGTEIPIDDSAAPVRDRAGHMRGIVLLFRDDRARREAEKEQKRAQEQLQAANRHLAELDRRKDEFIAILSHELRNPLAPIRFALPLLHGQRLDEGGRRTVGVVARQVEHLTRLVDDLLDVSRIASGKFELRRERVTLASVVTAANEAASVAIVDRRHTLKISIDDEPIWVDADAPRLAQVVTNLLDNSAKYTPPGGAITVEACRESGQAVIRVRDTGIGIPDDSLEAVFDMFRQVDRSDKPQGGLGIGLALVRRLVHMQGGEIEARSAGVGLGSEFIVRLPLAHDEAPQPDASVLGALGAAAVRRLRVLVVDDNVDLVEMLALTVESAGHDVRKAFDGRSAVAAALAYRPHVVLLDLGLPVVSGIEVARELRRHPDLSDARLVALTGWGQAEDRRQTKEAGFDYHLTKPADAAIVQGLLQELAQSV